MDALCLILKRVEGMTGNPLAMFPLADDLSGGHATFFHLGDVLINRL